MGPHYTPHQSRVLHDNVIKVDATEIKVSTGFKIESDPLSF